MQSRTITFSLIALCAVLGGFLLWRSNSDNAEKTQLQARVAALTQELAAAKTGAAISPPMTPTPPETRTTSIPWPPLSDQARRAALSLPKLSEDLAAARSRISELESKVLSLDADRATLAQQRQQELTASEESCRTRIVDTQRSLEAAQADLKAAQQRAALFESENENLRKAQPVAAKVGAKSPAPTAPEGELDELSRRRDTYLKSLIRRYREIDNEYRALLRDPQGPRSSDPAVFRIQGTLSQAEDDLRQIDSLTAKTLLVEKRRDKN